MCSYLYFVYHRDSNRPRHALQTHSFTHCITAVGLSLNQLSVCLNSEMGLLSCMYYFHITAWNSWLCFIQIHISSPPRVWVSLPGELLCSSPSSFIPYFLVYVNRSKAFWAPRQSMMIKHHAQSMTLKRSNIPYKCISHRRNSRNEEIHFWSQWPHVFSL